RLRGALYDRAVPLERAQRLGYGCALGTRRTGEERHVDILVCRGLEARVDETERQRDHAARSRGRHTYLATQRVVPAVGVVPPVVQPAQRHPRAQPERTPERLTLEVGVGVRSDPANVRMVLAVDDHERLTRFQLDDPV